MVLSRLALGMDIGRDQLHLVKISGRQECPRLDVCQSVPVPQGLLKLSFREPSIINQELFVSLVKETHARLLSTCQRISVSVPDQLGRVMLVDLESRLKNREEGADIIRWKLKKSLPFDVKDAHLDYQLLENKESGEVKALVALILRPVIEQFENLLSEAGLEPCYIDFTTFNLCRLFAKRLALADNSALVCFHGGSVSVSIFYAGLLQFYRSKALPSGEAQNVRMFQEIHNSFLSYQDSFPTQAVAEIFFTSDRTDVTQLSPIIREASGLEPIYLGADRFVTRSEGAPSCSLSSLAAALGAATRGL